MYVGYIHNVVFVNLCYFKKHTLYHGWQDGLTSGRFVLFKILRLELKSEAQGCLEI